MKRGFTLIELLTVVAMIAILAAIAVPNFLEAQTRGKIGKTIHDMAVIQASLQAYYADHMGYPPNTPAVREWVARAAAQPPEAVVPNEFPSLNERESSIVGSAATGLTFHADPANPDNWSYFFLSRTDLKAVTTPVAYLTVALPLDPFLNFNKAPFVYIDHSRLPRAEATVLPTSGRYLLASNGPDSRDPGSGGDAPDPFSLSMDSFGYDAPTSGTVGILSSQRQENHKSLLHPTRGPFTPYDPTNGTVSGGDILSLGGMSGQ